MNLTYLARNCIKHMVWNIEAFTEGAEASTEGLLMFQSIRVCSCRYRCSLIIIHKQGQHNTTDEQHVNKLNCHPAKLHILCTYN